MTTKLRVLCDHFSSTNGETKVYLKKYIYVVVVILLINVKRWLGNG